MLPELDLSAPVVHPTVHPVATLLQPTHTEGEYILSIDNTSMEKFTTCPRSAQWYLLHHREAPARNAALVFGGAIHAGLEAFYKGTCPHTAIDAHYATNYCPVDEYRTPKAAHEILDHYKDRSRLPDYHLSICTSNGVPIVERAFQIPIATYDINERLHLPEWTTPQLVTRIHAVWSGKIDLVALSGNRNRVVDHKTTSIEGDAFVDDFQLSNQTIGYVYAARQLFPDLDIRGFLLNAIAFRKPTGTGSLIGTGPRGGKPALNFFRHSFDYTPAMLQEWLHNTETLIGDFLASLVRDYFPTHTKWCLGKYGKCQYHPVCTLEPSLREVFLHSSAYTDVTWNPTTH